MQSNDFIDCEDAVFDNLYFKLSKTVTSEIPQCQMSHFLYLYYVDIQKLGMQAKQCLPNET